jgi:hypothetical protein
VETKAAQLVQPPIYIYIYIYIHTYIHTYILSHKHKHTYRLPNGCACLDVAVAREIADTEHIEFFPSEGGVSFVLQSGSEL